MIATILFVVTSLYFIATFKNSHKTIQNPEKNHWKNNRFDELVVYLLAVLLSQGNNIIPVRRTTIAHHVGPNIIVYNSYIYLNDAIEVDTTIIVIDPI